MPLVILCQISLDFQGIFQHFIGSLGLLHVWNMYLVGGILTPPKNMKVKWDYCSQYMGKTIYKMFQTTNQVQFLSNISYPAKNVRFFAGELVDNPMSPRTILDEFLPISDWPIELKSVESFWTWHPEYGNWDWSFWVILSHFWHPDPLCPVASRVWQRIRPANRGAQVVPLERNREAAKPHGWRGSPTVMAL